ncbi:PIG-L deacetylase family protein [Achromobacter sp. Root170]|uniref:PIG-L deacetylase family protein n=1 Tax=Achromobacter sp. Root170 TaxID=1736480 RepID=UPI0006F3FF54|nr:PIG-L deacetylase family protein [Achromobacter sp. Root170]KRB11840.1 GlcNAc-PI de-N-acetylase [Achromobacter sp. Root170]
MANSMVVVTAHVGDFVWRCGGAMALHAQHGVQVHLVCLSYGENGESNSAWKGDTQREAVKAQRHAEAQAAAQILGVSSVDFHDLGDYPLPDSPDAVRRISETLRRTKPSVVLTHPEHDPSNLDHCRTFEMTLRGRMQAMAPGHGADFVVPPQVLCFEPHQTELCGFKPNVLLDITEVWERKWQAMQAMPTQSNLWAYYERVALQRGAQAGRRGKTAGTRYGEAYQSIFPAVVSALME